MAKEPDCSAIRVSDIHRLLAEVKFRDKIGDPSMFGVSGTPETSIRRCILGAAFSIADLVGRTGSIDLINAFGARPDGYGRDRDYYFFLVDGAIKTESFDNLRQLFKDYFPSKSAVLTSMPFPECVENYFSGKHVLSPEMWKFLFQHEYIIPNNDIYFKNRSKARTRQVAELLIDYACPLKSWKRVAENEFFWILEYGDVDLLKYIMNSPVPRKHWFQPFIRKSEYIAHVQKQPTATPEFLSLCQEFLGELPDL